MILLIKELHLATDCWNRPRQKLDLVNWTCDGLIRHISLQIEVVSLIWCLTIRMAMLLRDQFCRKQLQLIAWLTDAFQKYVTRLWLMLRAWFIHCWMSLQPEMCLFVYSSNVFFMDWPVPSLVFHSSLWQWKVSTWWLQMTAPFA